MNSIKIQFLLAEGLHSADLRQNILNRMERGTDNNALNYFDATEIRSFSTLSGDVHTYCHHDLTEKDTYIIQEMGDNPWQDLAAVCVSAQSLKSRNAHRVTAIIPVWKLGWHCEGGLRNPDVLGSHRLTAEMLASSGVDRLVTFTPLPDMFSALYPVRVETPDISQELIRRTRWNTSDTAVIIADEIDAVPYAGYIASKTGWPAYGLYVIGNFIYPDFREKNVLIFTNRFNSSLVNIAGNVAEHGSRVICYAPRIERLEEITRQYFESIITLDSDYAEYAEVLPVDKLITDWLITDILNTQ